MTSMGAVEHDRRHPLMRPDRRFRAYREGRFKLIETSAGERFLFDVAADPAESRDLAAEQPAELARLVASLERERERIGLPAIDAVAEASAARELDAETTQRLRELGYVE